MSLPQHMHMNTEINLINSKPKKIESRPYYMTNKCVLFLERSQILQNNIGTMQKLK